MWPFTSGNGKMRITRIDEKFSVAGQIRPEQVEELAALGFKAIVCARPDNEERGQPGFAEIAAAAKRSGLAVLHVPMTGGMPAPDQLARFRKTMAAAQGPVLGYCRSGARAANLYAAGR